MLSFCSRYIGTSADVSMLASHTVSVSCFVLALRDKVNKQHKKATTFLAKGFRATEAATPTTPHKMFSGFLFTSFSTILPAFQSVNSKIGSKKQIFVVCVPSCWIALFALMYVHEHMYS